jgi:hypothetical protein
LAESVAVQVAACWIKGMERGAYLLPFPNMLINAVNHAQAGLVAPGLLPWPLDVMMAPFLSLLKPLMRSSVCTTDQ